jgi:hypothetical protein
MTLSFAVEAEGDAVTGSITTVAAHAELIA